MSVSLIVLAVHCAFGIAGAALALRLCGARRAHGGVSLMMLGVVGGGVGAQVAAHVSDVAASLPLEVGGAAFAGFIGGAVIAPAVLYFARRRV